MRLFDVKKKYREFLAVSCAKYKESKDFFH